MSMLCLSQLSSTHAAIKGTVWEVMLTQLHHKQVQRRGKGLLINQKTENILKPNCLRSDFHCLALWRVVVEHLEEKFP